MSLIHGVQPEGLTRCHCVGTTTQGRSTVSSGPSEPLLLESMTSNQLRLTTYVPQTRVDVGSTIPSGVHLACAHCRASWATSGPNSSADWLGDERERRTVALSTLHHVFTMSGNPPCRLEPEPTFPVRRRRTGSGNRRSAGAFHGTLLGAVARTLMGDTGACRPGHSSRSASATEAVKFRAHQSLTIMGPA